MNRRQLFAYTVFALTGLAFAVGLTTIATSLTSQRIGLQDEPLSAGQELAPARERTQSARPEPRGTETTEEAPTQTTTVDDDGVEIEEFDDDSSGHGRGRGRGRGRGGDDDD